jgi:prepilin-type N-terminal cleavage/methylation domain-containing protein
MKKNNRKLCLLPVTFSTSKSVERFDGFSLIELVVSIAISSIVVALASQALIRTQVSFTKDQKIIENGQRISSILEIIGREIRQAGELIVDSGFPTIQVKSQGTKGSSIIIYRAISSPISMCTAFPTGTAVTGLSFAIDTPTPSSCQIKASAISPLTNKFPPTQKEDWLDKRVAGGGTLFGVVNSNASKTAQPFLYTGETSTSGANSMILSINMTSFTTTSAINLGDSAYLVVKKEYMICGTDLKVRINSKVESTTNTPACAAPNPVTDPTAVLDTVATNVSSLNINMITREKPTLDAPDPASDNASGNGNNQEFPTATRDWQNIQGVIVDIKSVDPLADGGLGGRNTSGYSTAAQAKVDASLSARGVFYPRNVLSSK